MTEGGANGPADGITEQVQGANTGQVAVNVKGETQTVDPKNKKGFDANTYAGKKTVTQTLFDLALISANASHLKLLFEQHWAGNTPDFFILVVTLLILSIVLQLVAAVLLFLKIRLDINNEEDQSRAHKLNDSSALIIVFITIINVFVSTFSSYASPSSED